MQVDELCHTKWEPAPWIGIDYGTTVTVQTVEIFNRRDCCAERTRNVDVFISDELPTSSNQTFSGNTLLGHFDGPATNGQLITIQGKVMPSGRYVIVQMDHGSLKLPLNLREVKAFGKSPSNITKKITQLIFKLFVLYEILIEIL